eukprot:TRINITY_DN1407_c0_g1_i9.p1 TRINITY_DN1407_c0_g1~~TRINITY_DN1407_c0_g1_i9.p1  ORF type:complete len:817 (-),score=186.46 TRINITY_DN1407_c0_g1_i9:562-3012(-)
MASMRSKFVAEGSLGTVRVNQKALIDKLLARYKDEFAVFRELTQNSDDAGASEVCIVIDEENNVARVSNNGRVFRAEDWERLQSIADGNPDENTTGMFGVGFYSVFALSDFPIVRSGDQALLFEWQGNQLATRTLMLKARGDGQWTDVVLEGLKGKVFDDIKKAGYLKLIRYLAEMLPFARNLRHIEIRTGHTGTSGGLGDITTETNNTDYSLRYQATKIQTPLPYLSVRREARSPAGFFHMEELVASEVQLSIKTYLRTPVPTPTPTPTHTPTSAPIPTPTSASVSVVSPSPSTLPTQTPLAPPTQTTAPVGLQQLLPTPSPAGNEATVQETVPTRKKFDYDMVLTETCYLTLLDTMLSVKVDQATAAAIADILKKNTPSRTRLGLLCQRSSDLARSVASIYTVANDTTVVPPREDRRGLHRFVDRGGRIFVGFPTGQSTGLDVDISAQLYLTMEREHIDFKNEIRTWNEDLIRMCGVALRLYYEKMTSLKQRTLPAPAPAPAPSSVPPPSSGLEAPSDETTNPTQDPPTVANHMTAPPFVRDIPYQLEFTFDSAEPCTITVYFLASDNGEVRNGLSGKMQSVPVSFPGGLSQVFRLPLEGFLSLSPHKPEALAYDAAESTYPFIITLRTLAERDVPVCIRQQITYTTVLLCGDGTYAIKTLHQRIRYGGASYGLHDVYGVDTGHAQDAEGTRECVVCLTEPRDTTVLPCRHMCLCHPCAETMRTQTNKCPICRAPVKALLKIALPPSDEKGSPRTWSSSAGVSCPPSAAAAALGAGSIEIGSTITHEEEEEEEEEELVNNRRTSRGAADPEVPM